MSLILCCFYNEGPPNDQFHVGPTTAKCKVKTWGPLFKNDEESQDDNNRAFNRAQGPSKHRP